MTKFLRFLGAVLVAALLSVSPAGALLQVNELSGFGVRPASITWSNTANLDRLDADDNHDFTSVDFGAAAADRYIILGLGRHGLNEMDLAITIGGVTATKLGESQQENGNPNYVNGEVWIAAVPTGTSGTINVSASASWSALVVSVTVAYGINPAAFDTATWGATSTSLSTDTINVPAGGLVVAGVGYGSLATNRSGAAAAKGYDSTQTSLTVGGQISSNQYTFTELTETHDGQRSISSGALHAGFAVAFAPS